MIAPALAGAICVRNLCGTYFAVGLYGCHLIFSCFPLLNFAGTAINAVTVDSRTCFGIAGAFRVVDFPENKFEISARRHFGAVRDAIHRYSPFIGMVALKRPFEQRESSVFIQRTGTRTLSNGC
jgi:hypothetical protein